MSIKYEGQIESAEVRFGSGQTALILGINDAMAKILSSGKRLNGRSYNPASLLLSSSRKLNSCRRHRVNYSLCEARSYVFMQILSNNKIC